MGRSHKEALLSERNDGVGNFQIHMGKKKSPRGSHQ